MEERTKLLILLAVVMLLMLVIAIVIILIVLFRPIGHSNLPFRDKDYIFVMAEDGGYLSTCHDSNPFVSAVINKTSMIDQNFYWRALIGKDKKTFQLSNYHSQRDGEGSLLINSSLGLVVGKDEGGNESWYSLEEQGLATGLYKIKSALDNRYLNVSNIYNCSHNRVGLQSMDLSSNFKFRITLPS